MHFAEADIARTATVSPAKDPREVVRIIAPRSGNAYTQLGVVSCAFNNGDTVRKCTQSTVNSGVAGGVTGDGTFYRDLTRYAASGELFWSAYLKPGTDPVGEYTKIDGCDPTATLVIEAG